MNFKNITLTALLLVFSFALHASASCPVPPPTEIIADAIGHNYVDISWDRNVGDVSYRIRVTDTGGSVVAIDTILDNNYHLGNLIPDTEYSFTIRASSCEDGPFGTHISSIFRTSTVVVGDLVIYLNCPEGSPTTTGSVSPGDTSVFTLDPTEDPCYFIESDMTLPSSNISVKLLLTPNSSGGLSFREIPPFSEAFNIVDQGGIHGEYTSSDNSPYSLFDFNFGWILAQEEFEAKINWRTPANLLITDCSRCNPSQNLIAPEQSDAEEPASLYPNPVKNQLNIKVANHGQMEIRDITGRLWYTAAFSQKENNLQILTDDWPKGTYIFHWYKINAPPSIQYFIKI